MSRAIDPSDRPLGAFQALRRANRRNEPGHRRAMEASEVRVRRMLAAESAAPAVARRSAVARPAGRFTVAGRPRRRLVGVSAAAAVLAVAVCVGVLLTVWSPGVGAPQDARAAVRKAANATSAGGSGTIAVTITGETRMVSTLAWHGDDIRLTFPAEPPSEVQLTAEGPQEVRLVEGRLYVTSGGGVWYHDAALDRAGAGDAAETTQAHMLIAARDKLARGDLLLLLREIAGLEERSTADGAVVYSGVTTAEALLAGDIGVVGLPQSDRPLLKVEDLSTPVAVKVTVGADGLLRSVRTAHSGGGFDWTYTARYRMLGTTPAIQAPDPDTVVEVEQQGD